jgi:hypothetical protein
MERGVRIFSTVVSTGDPVEVFFPGKDKIIVAYKKGYIPIFPADGRTGDWLETDLLGDKLRGMMRVRFWNNDLWEERLLVEAWGSVGDVREDGVESLPHVQLGPVRVVGICRYHGSERYLALFHEGGEGEELRTDGRIIAFCMQKDDAVVVDAVVVRESHYYYHNMGVWVRFDGKLVKRYKLVEEGEIETGQDTATILKRNGEVFLAKPTKSVGRLLADGAWAVGLSPDGSRLVMLLQKPKGWFWDFRLTSKPIEVIHELEAPSLKDLEIPIQQIILRISPDLRWAVLATSEYVAVLPVPEVEL